MTLLGTIVDSQLHQRPRVEPSLTAQMVVIFAGRLLAFALSFATPLVLVRIFTQADYGLYKQLLLIHATLTPILTLGLPQSLFYFVPRSPQQRDIYISHAVLTLILLGCLGSALLLGFGGEIARALNNPAIDPYLPLVAAFLVLFLIGSILESLMVIFRDAKLATLTIVISEFLRAAFTIAAGLLTGSMLVVFVALGVWGGTRVVALAAYLRRLRVGLQWPLPNRLREQLRYAIPCGLATIGCAVADNLHQYVVSHLYSPTLFAIYSVGFLQIPLVAVAFQSVVDVTLVRLTELWKDGGPGPCARLIGDSVTKLGLVLLPLYVWIFLNARDLIVLLFTDRFEASVDIFLVSLTLIPLTALGVDYALQAFSETGFILRANLVRLGLSAALLAILVPVLGPVGAALATVLAMATMKWLMMCKVSRWLGVSVRAVLPWGRLGRILAASALAGLAAAVASRVWTAGPAARLLVSACTFAVCYVTLVWNTGLIGPEQKRNVNERMRRLVRQLGPLTRRWPATDAFGTTHPHAPGDTDVACDRLPPGRLP